MKSLDPSPRPWLVALCTVALAAAALAASPALGFCGFYVAKADTDLFNQASKVVIVRDGERTVLTMSNDYQGDAREFAMVVPVPTFLEREQIHVGDGALIDHLDAYTAPRLVEYFDGDPCARFESLRRESAAAPRADGEALQDQSARQLGVTIEASYTVGEYDILILSAEESAGLETWLRENGYRLPDGAARVLSSYLKQGMRFFVAKVNLDEQARLGYSQLRPLQIAFETPKFMLPIRLGTVNADGPQELFVFVLTRTGRVETANYRTVKLPTDLEVPAFVEDEFADFYRDLFSKQVEAERMKAVFLEYAWDMGWCDPCAADPLSADELRRLGVFWVDADSKDMRRSAGPRPQDVFVTRLHLRYTADSFPQDLRFQETGDRTNFQGRYVIRHPWTGSRLACPEARRYRDQLAERQRARAQTLARLTGWELESIHERMDLATPAASSADEDPWWKRVWGRL